jgi:hypothetical protein
VGAHEGAGVAEFFGVPKRFAGISPWLPRQGRLRLAGLLGDGDKGGAQALVSKLRQQIVDGDVLVGKFAGDAGDEGGEAAQRRR